jgi:hypothetical protein
MEIIKLLNKCMEDAGAVRKTERNTHQNFNFRGIDSVVNAVSPAFRKHGVVVVPQINDIAYETVTIGQNRTQMGHVRVNVTYTFFAPDGSSVASTVCAESMDSGDKATAKAMSVAFRTALLQTLCLPTDDTDPDADTYVRSEAPKTQEQPKSEPAPQAKRAELGSKAKAEPAKVQSAKPAPARQEANDGLKINPVSDSQIKYIRGLAAEVGSDDDLLHSIAGKTSLKDLNSKEASNLIADLMAIKAGEAQLRIDGDGKATVIR